MDTGPIARALKKWQYEYKHKALPPWVYQKAHRNTDAEFAAWFPAAVRYLIGGGSDHC